MPFDTFSARVERIAPAAATLPGRSQSLVKVLCRVDNCDGKLKAGMTGFARIHRGSQSLATLLWTRALKEIRTEFWW